MAELLLKRMPDEPEHSHATVVRQGSNLGEFWVTTTVRCQPYVNEHVLGAQYDPIARVWWKPFTVGGDLAYWEANPPSFVERMSASATVRISGTVSKVGGFREFWIDYEYDGQKKNTYVSAAKYDPIANLWYIKLNPGVILFWWSDPPATVYPESDS